MASDSAPPDPPGRSGSEAPGGRSEQSLPPERFGPLAVERHRKDDGRALILYTRVEDQEP
ncbi:MAG TPA: hypothetical protein VGO14_10730 [Solirubrobacteraceae bacterium]|jgi:hypothetical protein|nr:hypothetical protein [Solirubrobacteraceae bacterium]